MELQQLTHKIEMARTKGELEDLGIEHLTVDVDKRKAKEVIRAELLGLAEEKFGSVAEPAPEKPDEPAPKQPKIQAKMGRNVVTGRIMPWTAAMAKLPHMEEV